MKELLIYISQAGLLLGCCYLIYKALYSRGLFHRTKRFVLLFMSVASFTLPLCRITIQKEIVGQSTHRIVNSAIIQQTVLTETEQQISGEVSVMAPLWLVVLAGVYFAGVAALLSYRIAGLRRVNAIIKTAIRRQTHQETEIIVIPCDITAFSFRNRIIISQSDLDENYDMIVAHEMVHIKQHHSVDLLLANLVLSFQWFNPFVWLLRHELILAHEFAADHGVLQSGIDAKKYQYLLISKSAGDNGLIPVVNHFRSSDLHKRILTMKQKTSKSSQFKLLIILPLILIGLAAFAKTEYSVHDPATETEIMPEKEQFHMPYEGRIRAQYGKMTHPIFKSEAIHTGIDVIVTNDTVRAPYSGVVKSAKYYDDYGNKLVVTHNDGLETTYAHLAEFLVGTGATVAGGEPIAIVGNTGLSTGKHLHLECRVNGELADPVQTLPLSPQ